MFPYSSWGNAIFLTVANKNLPYILHFTLRDNFKACFLLFIKLMLHFFQTVRLDYYCRRALLSLLPILKPQWLENCKHENAPAQDTTCFSSPYCRSGEENISAITPLQCCIICMKVISEVFPLLTTHSFHFDKKKTVLSFRLILQFTLWS